LGIQSKAHQGENMRHSSSRTAILLAVPLLLVSHLSFSAGWDLDNSQSALYFTSTKNKDIQEQSTFTKLSGHIDENGQGQLTVSLNSVDTRVPIRDQRMREVLFQTFNFPDAVFTVTIDSKQMQMLNDKQPHTLNVDGMLDLHGVKHEIKTDVIAQEMSDTTLQVKNAQPIVLNVDDYNMGAGVEELKTLATLASIDHTVPVNFTLTFNKTP
jgi:polyisoprenoid-binding protein YceI